MARHRRLAEVISAAFGDAFLKLEQKEGPVRWKEPDRPIAARLSDHVGLKLCTHAQTPPLAEGTGSGRPPGVRNSGPKFRV